MIYTTAEVKKLSQLLESIKDKVFDINTQYKFLKIAKIIKEEEELIEEQEFLLLKHYAEVDENGNFITSEDGGIKVKDGKIAEFGTKLMELKYRRVQLPDIYFSLDELEPLNLSLGQLELLTPLIK